MPFPSQGFQFPQAGIAGGTRRALDGDAAEQAKAALSAPNRDDLLAVLVQKGVLRAVPVYGEDMTSSPYWYDLRGIRVDSTGCVSGASNLSRICWDYAIFDGVNLSGAEFNGSLLRSAVFRHADLTDANLDNADLTAACFGNCDLRGANLRLARLKGVAFIDCKMDDARLDNCIDMDCIVFSQGSARRAVFTNCSLRAATFMNVDLTEAVFLRADLTAVDFFGSILTGADFTAADLSKARLDNAEGTRLIRLLRTRLHAAYLGDMDVSAIAVSHLDWANGACEVGEELEADHPPPHNCSVEDRRRLYGQAEIIYRALSERYRQAGQIDEYLQFRYRMSDTRRKLLGLDAGGVKCFL